MPLVVSIFLVFFLTTLLLNYSVAQHLWGNAPRKSDTPNPEPPEIESLDPPILNGVCAILTLNPCVPLAKCVPTVPIIGKAVCICPSGYGGDGKKAEHGGQGCVNVDECRSGLHTCDLHSQECLDTQGSYECRCKPGFAMAPNGKLCLDIDECQQPSLNTCDPKTSVCHNLEGSFRCDCIDPTKVVDEFTGICKDMDECTYMNGAMNPCEQICIDQIGGVSCGCRPGYRLKPDGTSCEDVDECVDPHLHSCDPHGVISRCVNTVGGYNCECNRELGYETASDGKTCTNLDECSEYPYICGGGSSCCKDLAPPQRFACTIPTDSPNTFPFLSSLTAGGLLGGFSADDTDYSMNEHLLPNDMEVLHRDKTEEFNSFPFERKLQSLFPTLTNILSRQTNGITPILRIGRGVQCPNGFILGADLYRNKIRQQALKTVKSVFTSSITNQPIDPKDVTDGIVSNTNAVSNEFSKWYTELSSMPMQLISATDHFTNVGNLNPFSGSGSAAPSAPGGGPAPPVSGDTGLLGKFPSITPEKILTKKLNAAVLGGVIGGVGGGIVADKVQNCGIDDNFCNRSGLTKKHAYGLPKL